MSAGRGCDSRRFGTVRRCHGKAPGAIPSSNHRLSGVLAGEVVDYITHSTGDIYMSGSRLAPSMSLLVAAIVAGVSAVSCTKEADRSPTLETAASSVTTVRAAD